MTGVSPAKNPQIYANTEWLSQVAVQVVLQHDLQWSLQSMSPIFPSPHHLPRQMSTGPSQTWITLSRPACFQHQHVVFSFCHPFGGFVIDGYKQDIWWCCVKRGLIEVLQIGVGCRVAKAAPGPSQVSESGTRRRGSHLNIIENDDFGKQGKPVDHV